MDAFFVSVEELFDPISKGKPWSSAAKSDERGVVSAASYEARKFGVHSALPLRTAYKLCPHAIFVEGHPERYREYSGRMFEILRRFSPLVEMASVDEAYLDMTGTERLHGPRPSRRASVARNRQVGYAAELFDRHRLFAAGGQDRLGSGQAERHSARAARRRSAVSRAARSAQNSGRRQGDGEESARARHSPHRRSCRAGRQRARIALRQMGPGVGRQSAGARCRRLVRCRDRRARRSEIDQPRAHVQYRYEGRRASWKPRSRIWPRRWAAVCASMACTRAPSS